MNFLVLMGLQIIVGWLRPKQPTDNNSNTAFWFGTSFEDVIQNTPNDTITPMNSEYDPW